LGEHILCARRRSSPDEVARWRYQERVWDAPHGKVATAHARIVIASVDTYLRFAEAVNRLDIAQADQMPAVTDLAG
jgi:hypothetical protein